MQNQEEVAFQNSVRKSEKAFMGAILLDNTLMDYAVQHVGPSSLVVGRNRPIFAAMVELHKKHRTISPDSILGEMKEHGDKIETDDETYINSLVQDVPVNLTTEKDDHFQRFALVTTFTAITDLLLSDMQLADIANGVASKFAELRQLQGVDPLQIEVEKDIWRNAIS
jgi:hypothetical protein